MFPPCKVTTNNDTQMRMKNNIYLTEIEIVINVYLTEVSRKSDYPSALDIPAGILFIIHILRRPRMIDHE